MNTLGRFARVLVTGVIGMFLACGGSGGDSDGGTTAPPPTSTTAVGYLYVSAGTSIDAFTRAQAGFNNTALPALSLLHSLGYTLGDLALDRSGNIWAVGVGSNTVVRFKASSTPGSVTPDLTITSSDLKRPWGIAFDKTGNLWVSNSAGGGTGYSTIIRFNSSVLGLSGNQTLSPSLIIGPPASGVVKEQFSLVHGLAFDASGSLWAGGPSTILRFINPQNLSGNITPTPDGVISKAGYGTQFGFSGMIAFDNTGALWLTGCEGIPCVDFAMKFNNPVFAGVVSPPPATKINLGSGRQSNGLAFDGTGSLWIIFDAVGRGIVSINNPGSLGSTANLTAAITLTSTATSGISKLVFFPTPGGLPIY